MKADPVGNAPVEPYGADPPRDIFAIEEFEPLFGREAELSRIAAFWLSQRGALTICGGVGLGKTALARAAERALLDQVADPPLFRLHLRAAPRRGGAKRLLLALEEGLRARGLLPRGVAGEPLDQMVRRVRDVLRLQRGLVILDGLDALQHPPHIRGGRIRNRVLSDLIEAMAPPLAPDGRVCGSLLLCLSRQTVPEAAEGRRMTLAPLSAEAGAALLASEGVEGDPAALARAASALEGCPLTLRRAGRLLRRTSPAGGRPKADDVAEIDQQRLLFDADGPIDFEARRAAEAIAQEIDRIERLPRGAAGRGGPEMALLTLASLKAGGVGAAERARLLEPPALPGMTEALLHLRPIARKARLDYAARRLAAMGLVRVAEPREDASGAEELGDRLVAPLLVRAAMRERLRNVAPEALGAARRSLSPAGEPSPGADGARSEVAALLRYAERAARRVADNPVRWIGLAREAFDAAVAAAESGPLQDVEPVRPARARVARGRFLASLALRRGSVADAAAAARDLEKAIELSREIACADIAVSAGRELARLQKGMPVLSATTAPLRLVAP